MSNPEQLAVDVMSEQNPGRDGPASLTAFSRSKLSELCASGKGLPGNPAP